MNKWEVELSAFRLNFAPSTIIKGQGLTDFIVESTCLVAQEASPLIEEKNEKFSKGTYEPYTNGSSSIKSSGAGLVLTPKKVANHWEMPSV